MTDSLPIPPGSFPVKYVFIDFDGTLIDSLQVLYSVYSDFLHRRGIEASVEGFEQINGLALTEIIALLKEEHGLEEKDDFLRREYELILRNSYVAKSSIFPGAQKTLQYIKDCGAKLAIVSSAPKDLVDAILEANGLSKAFEGVITVQPGEKGKPHPAVYERALRTFKIESYEALAIEDSIHGATAALSAGISTLFLEHGNKEKAGVLSAHPMKSALLAVADWEQIYAIFIDLAAVSGIDFSE